MIMAAVMARSQDFLVQRGYSVQYRGFDVSDQMIRRSKEIAPAVKQL